MTTSIPLWVPLVVAAMGLFATITGVIITQRRSDRREDKNYECERERERERWAREDAARTFDLRREAYIEFHGAVSSQVTDFNTVRWARRKQKRPEGYPSLNAEFNVFKAHQKVRIYGSSVVVNAAEKNPKTSDTDLQDAS